jgi:O-antigen/teichoic acid export membrane protein
MSGLRGITKNLSALFSGHAISILQQLALVPFFIHSYGKAGYGEWLALSAAVSYLGTLDFGVQTYVNQDLTVRYHNGDMQGFHIQQSTALRLLLGIVTVAAALALFSFLLPLQHWLRMDGSATLLGTPSPVVPANIVHGAIYLLALQILTNIPAGYFFGTFMVVRKAYIGGYWNNVKYLLLILVTIVCVWFHVSFQTLALAQLLCVGTALAGAMIHLRSIAPHIFPTLRYWDGSSVGKILSQSGHFAILWSSNFLAYQLPVLILQRSVGPVAVTLFAIMRTIFSMTRNQLNVLTQAMGPEITTLFGRKDWKALSVLYNYSERLVFSAIPIVNLGVLFLSPFLLVLWTHDRSMFLPHAYLLCAAVSIVMSTKEHKYQFQFSTNTVRELARFVFLSYLVLDGIWLAAIPRFGLAGLLWGWLGIELCQLLYIVRLNFHLFVYQERLDLKFLVRLSVLATALLLVANRALPYTVKLSLPTQVTIAIALGLLIFALDFPLFDLAPILRKFRERFKRKSAPQVAREFEQ